MALMHTSMWEALACSTQLQAGEQEAWPPPAGPGAPPVSRLGVLICDVKRAVPTLRGHCMLAENTDRGAVSDAEDTVTPSWSH